MFCRFNVYHEGRADRADRIPHVNEEQIVSDFEHFWMCDEENEVKDPNAHDYKHSDTQWYVAEQQRTVHICSIDSDQRVWCDFRHTGCSQKVYIFLHSGMPTCTSCESAFQAGIEVL
jgi:hypothetical protein